MRTPTPSGAHRRLLPLGRLGSALLAVAVALALGVGLGLGHALAARGDAAAAAARFEALNAQLDDTRQQLAASATEARQLLQAMTLKLSELQSRVVRLDAVGGRMADRAGLDPDEFGFDRAPALGGPETPPEVPAATDLDQLFASLEAQLDEREQQLRLLDDLIKDRALERESTVAGRPVVKGWASSGYGYRVDPFNGRRAWHGGVDFAGPAGSPVVAVAAGVVIQSGADGGYGNSVAIDHGDGLVTKYSHNRENLVAVGDLVKKGQPIATMGRTGRASGPHVHFEVARNGRSLNPAPYIQRAAR